jgi:hypothetical protein
MCATELQPAQLEYIKLPKYCQIMLFRQKMKSANNKVNGVQNLSVVSTDENTFRMSCEIEENKYSNTTPERFSTHYIIERNHIIVRPQTRGLNVCRLSENSYPIC